MINLDKAKKEFLNYASNYDSNNIHIKRKISHTLRVMDCSKKIAESLNLTDEEINLASLIGLLHDLARFEQRKIYNTFSDASSRDHGDWAVEILENNNYIRKYIETDQYDDIIKIAIRNHNKFTIEEGLNQKELLFAKIIRDADKLDIMYEGANIFYDTKEEIETIENLTISDEYFNQFIEKKQVYRKKGIHSLDSMICMIAFIFDIYFDYSKKAIFKEKYIESILNKFNFKDEKTRNRVEEIKKISNEYLK